jgi:long-subunit fatty acid transport protein
MFKNKIKKSVTKNMFEFFEAKGENCIKGRLVQGNVKIYPSIPKMANLF